MAKPPRKRISSRVETDLLIFSGRRCCICACLEDDTGVKTDGQIAHIDRNPANNNLDNLAYLCLRHHDLYDTIRSQSKGITAGELKRYRNKLYRNLGTDNRSSSSASVVAESQIRISEAILGDCSELGVPIQDLISFIVQEASRHPLLFSSPFMSLPLVFSDDVLLISWDGNEVRAERLLNRQEAYPLNDVWTSCLALYRKATLLPYRTVGNGQLLTRTEGQRAISIYRKLISQTNNFLQLLSENGQEPPQTYLDLGALVDEAEFALVNGENGKLVARLEAVLSTIHKLILNCAPQGTGAISSGPLPINLPSVEVPKGNRYSFLVVDDDEATLFCIRELLLQEGYAVTSANTTTAALQAMVEHEFDVVITDLVMCVDLGAVPEADGREVALAAKRSSAKTKVIVYTGFMEMSRIADWFKAGVDGVLGKGQTRGDDLLQVVRHLLDSQQSN